MRLEWGLYLGRRYSYKRKKNDENRIIRYCPPGTSLGTPNRTATAFIAEKEVTDKNTTSCLDGKNRLFSNAQFRLALCGIEPLHTWGLVSEVTEYTLYRIEGPEKNETEIFRALPIELTLHRIIRVA